MHDGKTASENILTIFARSFWLLPLLASADPVPPNIKHVVEPLALTHNSTAQSRAKADPGSSLIYLLKETIVVNNIYFPLRIFISKPIDEIFIYRSQYFK